MRWHLFSAGRRFAAAPIDLLSYSKLNVLTKMPADSLVVFSLRLSSPSVFADSVSSSFQQGDH